MTREQYESLPLTELKAIAKTRGIRGISGAKKIDIIEAMLEKDTEQEERKGPGENGAASGAKGKGKSPERGGARAEGSGQPREKRSVESGGGRRERKGPGIHAGSRGGRDRAQAENSHAGAEGSYNGKGRTSADNANTERERAGADMSNAGRDQVAGESVYTGGERTKAENSYQGSSQSDVDGNAGGRERASGDSYGSGRERTSGDSNVSGRERISVDNYVSGRERTTGDSYVSSRDHAAGDGNVGGRERTMGDGNVGSRERAAVDGNVGGRERAAVDSYGGGRDRTGEGETAGRDRAPQEGTLDSGQEAHGLLVVMTDGFGFIRSANYLPGENDIYVNPAMIRKFNLKTGDILRGNIKVRNQGEKFAALLYIKAINGMRPEDASKRRNFEDLTPIFPNERIHLERPGGSTAMRVVDLISPIGKGQRGMIVSPPKAGKTTLLKDVAKSITRNHPDMRLLILLIDERPEEVTDIRETVAGPNVEVIYSTFDELAEHHKRVSEMVVERAKRLVEHGQDVVILLDSITRLARAYNLVVPPSGRTLSGGLDPAALHMPKRFFGAARNMREGGSLTILATALVETGSKMDDVIYEEFKGTGNMELVLNRKLQEKRVFPAIDIPKSGTRREDLLLTQEELEAVEIMRKGINGMKADDAVENILNMFDRTRNNTEYVQMIKKTKLF